MEFMKLFLSVIIWTPRAEEWVPFQLQVVIATLSCPLVHIVRYSKSLTLTREWLKQLLRDRISKRKTFYSSTPFLISKERCNPSSALRVWKSQKWVSLCAQPQWTLTKNLGKTNATRTFTTMSKKPCHLQITKSMSVVVLKSILIYKVGNMLNSFMYTTLMPLYMAQVREKETHVLQNKTARLLG